MEVKEMINAITTAIVLLIAIITSWVRMEFKTNQNAESIKEMKSLFTQIDKKLDNIAERIAKIEGWRNGQKR